MTKIEEIEALSSGHPFPAIGAFQRRDDSVAQMKYLDAM